MSSERSQAIVDARNAAFWEELCGTGLARQVGITSDTPDALAAFDRAYLELYPYLAHYVDRLKPAGERVLEIGIGYGTLGQLLLDAGADYHGLDIAEGPVRMMQHRARLGGARSDCIVQGSVLAIPWPASFFDGVVSVGCLHHSGDLQRAVHEVHRVLRPGGRALVMLYNRHSLRRMMLALRRVRWADRASSLRASYDTSTAGEPAPHTDFVSRTEARRLFASFDGLTIESRNVDGVRVPPGIRISRERLLDNVGRVVGLDLYIQARKPS